MTFSSFCRLPGRCPTGGCHTELAICLHASDQCITEILTLRSAGVHSMAGTAGWVSAHAATGAPVATHELSAPRRGRRSPPAVHPAAAQTKSFRCSNPDAKPDRRAFKAEPSEPLTMPISVDPPRRMPHFKAKSGQRAASKQPQGPTVVSGDQASDLLLRGSGGRIT
jgi:hypothetical protein